MGILVHFYLPLTNSILSVYIWNTKKQKTAPLFTLREKITKEYKFARETVWGAITYNVKAAFYLPEFPKSEISERLFLLERMFTIHKSWLRSDINLSLTNDAVGCLNMWVRNYIYGGVPPWYEKELNTGRLTAVADGCEAAAEKAGDIQRLADKGRYVCTQADIFMVLSLVHY